jgi:hypothetical protein
VSEGGLSCSKCLNLLPKDQCSSSPAGVFRIGADFRGNFTLTAAGSRSAWGFAQFGTYYR